MPQPAGIILDDMFQPLSIIRQGYRSVVDPLAQVYDTWPEKVGGEFHRKVRTLAGNFQLFQLAPWTLTPQNRVLFQLISHKAVRLVVPYLMVLLLVSQSGALRRFASLRSICSSSTLRLGTFDRRPPLQNRVAESHCGSSQRAARAQCRCRRRALQIFGNAWPTMEDMEFK